VPNPASAHRPGVPPFVGRLFSLTGLLPLGAFLIGHLVVNAGALRGDAAFAGSVRLLHRLPALALLEWALVFAPLLLHGAIGVWLIATRAQLAEPSPYPPALRIAMRATGVVAIAFLVVHLPELRFRTPGDRPGGGELATLLVADLSSTRHGVPWTGAAYLLGTGCVTFHFATGLWASLATTRLGGRPRVRRWAGWGAGAIGAAMWMLFANVVVFYATGARLFGQAAQGQEPERSREPCPTRDVTERR
jgi:succinate dehydrogenase/fumarate reductase cytochrome b subunit (b558 family)